MGQIIIANRLLIAVVVDQMKKMKYAKIQSTLQFGYFETHLMAHDVTFFTASSKN